MKIPVKKDTSYLSYLTEIEIMLEEGCFDWAEETLSGIYEWVEQNKKITDRQIIAIQNIQEKGR